MRNEPGSSPWRIRARTRSTLTPQRSASWPTENEFRCCRSRRMMPVTVRVGGLKSSCPTVRRRSNPTLRIHHRSDAFVISATRAAPHNWVAQRPAQSLALHRHKYPRFPGTIGRSTHANRFVHDSSHDARFTPTFRTPDFCCPGSDHQRDVVCNARCPMAPMRGVGFGHYR